MNSVIRSLSAVLIGLLLIIFKDSAVPFLVRMIGAAFFFPALISMINVYAQRKSAPLFSTVLMSIADVGSMLLGLWLIISPKMFLEMFVVVLAIALLCFSLFQIFNTLFFYGNLKGRWGVLLMPLLLTLFSVVVLFKPFAVISTATVVLGWCAVFSGVSDIFIYLLVRRKALNYLKKR